MSAVSALSPIAAHAAEPQSAAASTLPKVTVSGEAENTYTVDSSESATPLALSLRETPQSVTIITRARIEDQALDSMREVLDNTPGVYSYAYDTERVIFTARGFTIDNVLFDGVPSITNPSTSSIDDTLDTALYDRIEIVRGATGLTSGAGNPAAAVNLVRKHADSDAFEADMELTVARWNYRRLEADVSSPLTTDGKVRGRVVGVYQDRDSFQDLYSNERKVAYGVIDADLAKSTLLSVGFDYQDNDPRGNTWGSFPLFLSDGSLANFPRSVTTAANWSFWDRTTRSGFVELTQSFANEWSAKATVNYRRYKELGALLYLFGFPDTQTGEGLDAYGYLSDGEITQRSINVHATGPIELFGRRHEVVIGVNHSRIDNDAGFFPIAEDELDEEGALNLPPGNFFGWNGSYPQPTFATERVPNTEQDIWQDAAYVAGRLVLAEPLKLVAGARYVKYENEDAFGVDYRKLEFNEVIPYAGLIWDVTEQFSLFTSYTGIFTPQNNRTATGSLLDPVKGRSYEVGIKGEHFDGRLNTSLTVFKTGQSNVAAPVTDENGDPVIIPGTATQASRAVDGTESKGFEMEVAGEILEGWNASLGWSHYQIDDADGRAFRTFTPRTLVRGFTTWTPNVLDHKLKIGGGVNYQSKSDTSSSPIASPDGPATFRQKDVTLVNLMVSYEVTPSVSVQFNSDNLFDEEYYILDEYDNTSWATPVNYSVSFAIKL